MNASKKGILKGGELHTNPVGTIVPSPNLNNKSRLGPSQWTWMWSRSREKARASRGRTTGVEEAPRKQGTLVMGSASTVARRDTGQRTARNHEGREGVDG